MNKSTQKTIIVVASSTLIGFLGDVVMYSIAASKGGKFRIHMPTGMALLQVLGLGIGTGLIVDAAVNAIVETQKSQPEKALDKLVKADIDRIDKGQLKTRGPIRIEWASGVNGEQTKKAA